jgi:hypothetical protein
VVDCVVETLANTAKVTRPTRSQRRREVDQGVAVTKDRVTVIKRLAGK